MNTTQDTTRAAWALYGSGWCDLPRFVREAAAGFVADLLDLDAGEVLTGDAMDRVHECADAAVPVYDYQRYAVMAETDAVHAIEAALQDMDEYGDVAMRDENGQINFAALLGVGMYGAISNAFSVLLANVETADGFEALGLDADAAEIAAALLPEWSGTVRELVEAAPRLASEGVTR